MLYDRFLKACDQVWLVCLSVLVVVVLAAICASVWPAFELGGRMHRLCQRADYQNTTVTVTRGCP